MKPDLLKKETVKPGFKFSCQKPKGHLNGLLISFSAKTIDISSAYALKKMVETTQLRVKYLNSQTTHVQYSALPLPVLIDRCDMKHGSTGYKSLSDLISQNSLAKDIADENASFSAIDQNSLSNYGSSLNIQFYVPLGSIDLQNGDTIDVELIDRNQQLTSNEIDLSVASISSDPTAPFMLVFCDSDSDKNELHSQVVESYIYDEGNTKVDFDYEVRSTTVTHTSDRQVLLAMASIFTATENMNIERTFNVFDSTDTGVPEDVQIKLLKTVDDISSLNIVNFRYESDINQYLKQRKVAIHNTKAIVNQAISSGKSRDLIQVIGAEQSK